MGIKSVCMEGGNLVVTSISNGVETKQNFGATGKDAGGAGVDYAIEVKHTIVYDITSDGYAESESDTVLVSGSFDKSLPKFTNGEPCLCLYRCVGIVNDTGEKLPESSGILHGYVDSTTPTQIRFPMDVIGRQWYEVILNEDNYISVQYID